MANMRRRQWDACVGGGGLVIGFFSRLTVSAPSATATATAGLIAAVWLETIRTIRTAFDTDHRQDDDGCWLGIGVDIFAAARRTRLIGKLDHFAHCETPFRPGTTSAGSVLFAIKGRTGLTVC
jgi:hypothetical protein